MMQTIELVSGSTFSFAGTVSNLDRSVAWGVNASIRVRGVGAVIDAFTTSMAQASDFDTTGNWTISLAATAAQTTAWYTAARNAQGELTFDLKFFNTAGADPVLRSSPIVLKLTTPITP
jgi:hypothetical protein